MRGGEASGGGARGGEGGHVGVRRRWSEVPLTVAGLTDAAQPLELDALHLHALCLSLHAAAAHAGWGGGEVWVDFQSVLMDSRCSPSLEVQGLVVIAKLDALDVLSRRAIQRLMREVLGAMVGRTQKTMMNPVQVFASAAPTGVLTANGFAQLVSSLQITSSESVVYAGWRAMCHDSPLQLGVDVSSFLSFFSVSAVTRQQACSLELANAATTTITATRPDAQPPATSHRAAPHSTRAGAGASEAGTSAYSQEPSLLLKQLLQDSETWHEFGAACRAMRRATSEGGKGGSDVQCTGPLLVAAAAAAPSSPSLFASTAENATAANAPVAHPPQGDAKQRLPTTVPTGGHAQGGGGGGGGRRVIRK